MYNYIDIILFVGRICKITHYNIRIDIHKPNEISNETQCRASL